MNHRHQTPTRRPHPDSCRAPAAACRPAVCTALVALLTLAAPAFARAPGESAAIYAAAAEQRLWLAVAGSDRYNVYARTMQGDFDRRAAPAGKIVALTASPDAAFAFFADHSVYRIAPETGALSPIRTLPDRALPRAVTTLDGDLVALVTADVAAAVEQAARRETTPAPDKPATPPPAEQAEPPADAPAPETPALTATETTTPTVAPDDNHLWLVHLHTGRWRLGPRTPLVATPPPAGPVSDIALGAAGNQLVLARTTGDGRVAVWRLDPASGETVALPPLALPDVTFIQPLVVNNQPLLVTAQRAAETDLAINAYRLPDAGGSWQTAPLTLPELETPFTRLAGAFAFNQHLGLLAIDRTVPLAEAPDHTWLVFAGLGQPPLERPGTVAEILAADRDTFRYANELQLLTLLMLIAAAAGIFAFRRDSLVSPVMLPAGMRLALLLQRLLALLIDLVPIGAIVLFAINERGQSLGWQDGLNALLTWGFQTGAVPTNVVLVWWAITVATFTLYALIMEAIAGRTIGKVLTRTRVVSETGEPPQFWQLAVRNVLRIVELVPLLWPVVFLVIITPRRQRLGDVFGRTIVVLDSPHHFQRTLTLRTRRKTPPGDASQDTTPPPERNDHAGDETSSDSDSKQDQDR